MSAFSTASARSVGGWVGGQAGSTGAAQVVYCDGVGGGQDNRRGTVALITFTTITLAISGPVRTQETSKRSAAKSAAHHFAPRDDAIEGQHVSSWRPATPPARLVDLPSQGSVGLACCGGVLGLLGLRIAR